MVPSGQSGDHRRDRSALAPKEERMKFMVEILAVVVGLGGLFALSFAIWGERLEGLFSPSACVRWFAASRDWAWAVAIALLISDLLLPIPATGVMAAVGVAYG